MIGEKIPGEFGISIPSANELNAPEIYIVYGTQVHILKPNDFSSKPFGEPRNFMGLAAAYGPFLPAVYHPFVLREAG